MAASCSIQSKCYAAPLHLISTSGGSNLFVPKSVCPTKRKPNQQVQRYRACCLLEVAVPSIDIPLSASINLTDPIRDASDLIPEYMQRLVLMDLDPGTAKLAIPILGPLLSAFSFLFIVRIVMSWYPKLPVEKFPYVVAYAPTEPILTVTRKVIPPLGGVDVTPVVWFGLISFLNEILVGPQGLLVLLSQQV
ncbi:protein COFACTOR ASSEMBLY OF COMPLEX C SUBUNIT B CCB3, chloroplastic isoform X1 [Lactuca sativa]|uniref:protein COFACTOR ASSEMBLY OF COMPLEX C SUBUNIT B CCB3, chloroplastic isoform X1 n=1 Tax=Lactuca sativa TaxID=4236 RepID=UPI000CD8E617|nr:protein COFACTOR ASSEMBLY OF COMPLEX C SUBUNIT B CCB3, chloroplastic isoform X1 [Lactuca sativa]